MSIQLLKKKATPLGDSDMEQFKKNLLKNRLRRFGIAGVVLAAAAACVWGVLISFENRTYSTYEVVKSFDRSDTMMTQYVEFLGYVLKYGKDGISCVDSNNKLIWSQTYNMQNPVVDVCRNSAAVAEKDGTEAMIFDESGLQGTIQTNLPIRQIAVSSQGVLAALAEDGDVMRLNLYDKKGQELVNSKFELTDTGYPLRISLSPDATKLAVVFLQVQDGGVNTCLAFYNFDSVGENYGDHMVAAQTVKGMVLPSVQFVDNAHCFAAGTGELLIYEGEQIPELEAEIPLEREVRSVFYSGKEIGLVMEGQEKRYALRVYNTQGKMEFETEFDMEYSTLKFSGNDILIYNEFECMMLNHAGRVFFQGAFEDSISNLYTLSGRRRYIVMHASKTEQIQLK